MVEFFGVLCGVLCELKGGNRVGSFGVFFELKRLFLGDFLENRCRRCYHLPALISMARLMVERRWERESESEVGLSGWIHSALHTCHVMDMPTHQINVRPRNRKVTREHHQSPHSSTNPPYSCFDGPCPIRVAFRYRVQSTYLGPTTSLLDSIARNAFSPPGRE